MKYFLSTSLYEIKSSASIGIVLCVHSLLAVHVISWKIKRSFTHELSFGFQPFRMHIVCGSPYESESRPFATIERSLVV